MTYVNILKIIVTFIGVVSGILGILIIIFTKFIPWYRSRIKQKTLNERIGSELYPRGVIERSTRLYLEPYCQSVDPSGGEEPRLTFGIMEKLFDAVDRALQHETEYRYLILLSDSGMGKTSFLLNYYAKYQKKRKKFYNIAIAPLGMPNVDSYIYQIGDKKNTVLFLDALDEDTLAIIDHTERLKDILNLTRKFLKVIITCRTQFFPKDEEIPKETGIVKIGPRAAGERSQHVFHKIYLSPFTDEQVDKYLRLLYPIWQKRMRDVAKEMVKKIPYLSIRPMLLAHIEDLVYTQKEIKYSHELYEEMVEAWLIREEGILDGVEKEPLRKFSEHLAVDLYTNREKRGSERISSEELTNLTKRWDITSLVDWKLTGRSLLNRDAFGNYKFAHRSIMEYLFVKRFTQNDENCKNIIWTDQMQTFLWEIIQKYIKAQNYVPFDLDGADLEKYQINLRNESVSDLQLNSIHEFLSRYDIFDKNLNKIGNGIKHYYITRIVEGDRIIIDIATGLMWQYSGSKNLDIEEIFDYKNNINNQGYAGYNDWRLPTLEEAMSIMVKKNINYILHLDPVFYSKQLYLWTSDKLNNMNYIVDYVGGYCTLEYKAMPYVRLVRHI